MTRQDVQNNLRSMGYSVSGKGKSICISIRNEDVSKEDITSLLSHEEFQLIDRIDFCRHRNKDSFDTVRIIFK